MRPASAHTETCGILGTWQRNTLERQTRRAIPDTRDFDSCNLRSSSSPITPSRHLPVPPSTVPSQFHRLLSEILQRLDQVHCEPRGGAAVDHPMVIGDGKG